MPEDNPRTISELTKLNKTSQETSDVSKQTLGEIRSLSTSQDKGNHDIVRRMDQQIADNKTKADQDRENAFELKTALEGLKGSMSFFKENLKDLGLGGGMGVLESMLTKVKAVLNLLLSPFVMIGGFIVGIAVGLKDATKAAKRGGLLIKTFALPLLAFNKAFEVMRNGITKVVSMAKLTAVYVGMFAKDTKISKIGQTIANAVRTAFTPVTAAINGIKNIFTRVRRYTNAIQKGTGAFGTIMAKVGQVFGGLAKSAMAIGRIVGRLFVPLNVLFVGFETIKTSIERFKTDGIFGGIIGALEGFVKGIVTIPLDLLKDGVAWIAGKLGFEKVSEGLKSFSFSELLSKLFDFVLMFPKWASSVFSNFVDGAVAKWEGFKESLFNINEWFNGLAERSNAFFGGIRDSIGEWFDNFFAGIGEGWNNFVGALGELPGKMIEAFQSVKNWVKKKIAAAKRMLNPLNWFRGDDDDDAGNFEKGGKIPFGKYGLVGEAGPEFVQGPATVTSAEKSRSLMQTATALLGGDADDRAIKGQVEMTNALAEQTLKTFNDALAAAGVKGKVSEDEIREAAKIGFENMEGNFGKLYAEYERKTRSAEMDLSKALDISLDDFSLDSPSTGNRIAKAEDDLIDSQMARDSGGSAVVGSGNTTTNVTSSSITNIMSSSNTRNEDSVSYINRSI